MKKNLLEIHAAVLLFGLAGLFGKWLDLSPFLIVLGRTAFAAAVLPPFLRIRKIGIRAGKDTKILLFLGILLAAHWVFFFHSIQVSSVAVGLLSYSSFPLFTALLEPALNRTRLRPFNLVLAGICLGGILLIVPRFSPDDRVFQGIVWGLAAGLSFAVLTVFNRRLAQRRSPLQMALYQNASAALVLAPVLLVVPAAPSGRDLLLLAVLGVLCTAAAHTLFIGGMRKVEAQTAAILSSLEPVYGILLAVLLLAEIPSPRTVLGGLIILGATLTATFRSKIPSIEPSGSSPR